jgi:hypothetical protein
MSAVAVLVFTPCSIIDYAQRRSSRHNKKVPPLRIGLDDLE